MPQSYEQEEISNLHPASLDVLPAVRSQSGKEPTESVDPETLTSPVLRAGLRARQGLAWSGIFFAVLQSVCTFFAAASWLRLAIGIGSFSISAWFNTALDRFHTDWLRIPMIVFAAGGALFNLVILAQVRYLRNRPASQWRRMPLTARKLWTERLQLALALVTLLLVAFEEYFHTRWSSHL